MCYRKKKSGLEKEKLRGGIERDVTARWGRDIED